MLISITEVRKGDVIIDGRHKTEVTRIRHNACSSFGTHVNDRECYERTAKVYIQEGQAKSEHFEESGLGDLEEDYHLLTQTEAFDNLRVV